MEADSEFWSGFMAGVFSTFGFCIAGSILFLLACARCAKTVPENWDV